MIVHLGALIRRPADQPDVDALVLQEPDVPPVVRIGVDVVATLTDVHSIRSAMGSGFMDPWNAPPHAQRGAFHLLGHRATPAPRRGSSGPDPLWISVWGCGRVAVAQRPRGAVG